MFWKRLGEEDEKEGGLIVEEEVGGEECEDDSERKADPLGRTMGEEQGEEGGVREKFPDKRGQLGEARRAEFFLSRRSIAEEGAGSGESRRVTGGVVAAGKN